MEIFGVGMSELLFVIIIALIVLGPKDMQKAGKTIGKWLRSIVTSDGWKTFQQTSRELRNLPNRLMREANEEVNKIGNELNRDINASNPAQARSGSTSLPPRSKPVQPTAPAAKAPAPEKPDSPTSESPNDNTDTNA
ncbi:MAG: hypothetical protein AB1649_02755 [Chloroflexota bacterium]